MAVVKVSKKKLWKAIRLQCLTCVGNSDEQAALCTSRKCSLYPYRFGRPLKGNDPEYIETSGKYVSCKAG